MESVLRGVSMYLILLVIFRIAGKRSLSQVTTFDFVLLLIIAEATQQALLGQDFSITNAVLVVATLIALDIGLSLLNRRWPRLGRVLQDEPLIIVENGKLLTERMAKARVDEEDILRAAREMHGLERLEQIKFAVLERNGGITVIPRSQ